MQFFPVASNVACTPIGMAKFGRNDRSEIRQVQVSVAGQYTSPITDRASTTALFFSAHIDENHQ